MPKAMPKRVRFTEPTIRALKRGIHWDSLLPAFGCRVSHRTRTWIVNIRGSKKRFGRFPAMGLAEARARARELMAGGVVSFGAELFHTLAEEFLLHGRTKRGRLLRPATVKEYRRALLIYARPLHRAEVRTIIRAQVADIITTVGRTSGTTTAMRTRAALSRFFGWCVATGKADANPVTGTEGYDVPRRARVLSDGELAALWRSTEDGSDFSMILRLCLWTGCRRTEAGGMMWSELSSAQNEHLIWTIPGTRTKNHRPLALPLAPQTAAALESWPRVLGKPTLFGRGANGFQAWSQSKRRLDARLGFRESWSLHDIRRSVQTRMLALGISRDLTNLILNHAMLPLDETYNRHTWVREKAAALAKWANEIERISSAPIPEVLTICPEEPLEVKRTSCSVAREVKIAP
jgi:integrase